jgi:hypothetical protein
MATHRQILRNPRGFAIDKDVVTLPCVTNSKRLMNGPRIIQYGATVHWRGLCHWPKTVGMTDPFASHRDHRHFLRSVVRRLQISYPNGVPGPDRVPLLALLHSTPLTEEQLRGCAGRSQPNGHWPASTSAGRFRRPTGRGSRARSAASSGCFASFRGSPRLLVVSPTRSSRAQHESAWPRAGTSPFSPR